MSDLVDYGAAVAALGTGLLSGFVFAFSNVVMPSLARQQPAAAIATMQTINVVVGNRLFSAMLAATTLLSVILGGIAVFDLGGPGKLTMLAASLAFLLFGISITAAVNVPMNRSLSRLDATSPEAMDYWRRFLGRWTFWNHVRTAGTAAACLLFIIAAFRP